MGRIKSGSSTALKRPNFQDELSSTTNDSKRPRLAQQGSTTLMEGLKSFSHSNHNKSRTSSVTSDSSASAPLNAGEGSLVNKVPAEIWLMISGELSERDNLELRYVSKGLYEILDSKRYANLDKLFEDKKERREFFRNNPHLPKGSYLSHYYQLMYESLREQAARPLLVKGHIPTVAEFLSSPLWAEKTGRACMLMSSGNAVISEEECSVADEFFKQYLSFPEENPRALKMICQAGLLDQEMLENSALQNYHKEFLTFPEVILNLVRGVVPNLEALSSVSKDTMNKKFVDIEDAEQKKAVIESNIFWRPEGGPTLEAVSEYIQSKDKTQLSKARAELSFLSSISLKETDEPGKKLELIEKLLEHGIAPDSLYLASAADALQVAIAAIYVRNKAPQALRTIQLLLEKEVGPNIASKLEGYARCLIHRVKYSDCLKAKKLEIVLQVMQFLLNKASVLEIGRRKSLGEEINAGYKVFPEEELSVDEEIEQDVSSFADNLEEGTDDEFEQDASSSVDSLDEEVEEGEGNETWQQTVGWLWSIGPGIEGRQAEGEQLALQFTEFMLKRTSDEDSVGAAQKEIEAIIKYSENMSRLGPKILNLVTLFLNKGIDLNKLTMYDQHILHVLVSELTNVGFEPKRNQLFESFLKSCLESPLDSPLENCKKFINGKSKFGDTALYYVIDDISHPDGKQPLWLAEALLKNGADPTIQNDVEYGSKEEDRSPLAWAQHYSQKDVVYPLDEVNKKVANEFNKLVEKYWQK